MSIPIKQCFALLWEERTICKVNAELELRYSVTEPPPHHFGWKEFGFWGFGLAPLPVKGNRGCVTPVSLPNNATSQAQNKELFKTGRIPLFIIFTLLRYCWRKEGKKM